MPPLLSRHCLSRLAYSKNQRGDASPANLPLKEIDGNPRLNCSGPYLIGFLNSEGNAVDVCTHQSQRSRGFGRTGGNVQCFVVDYANKTASDLSCSSVQHVAILAVGYLSGVIPST